MSVLTKFTNLFKRGSEQIFDIDDARERTKVVNDEKIRNEIKYINIEINKSISSGMYWEAVMIYHKESITHYEKLGFKIIPREIPNGYIISWEEE